MAIVHAGHTGFRGAVDDTFAMDCSAREPERWRWLEATTQLHVSGAIPPARYGHAAAVLDDYLWVLGGIVESGGDFGPPGAEQLPESAHEVCSQRERSGCMRAAPWRTMKAPYTCPLHELGRPAARPAARPVACPAARPAAALLPALIPSLIGVPALSPAHQIHLGALTIDETANSDTASSDDDAASGGACRHLQLAWSKMATQGAPPRCRFGHSMTAAVSALWVFGGRTQRCALLYT